MMPRVDEGADQTVGILKIVQVGHPVLRGHARPLAAAELGTPELARLVEQMRETMRDAPGVGLAAPQVGLPLQLVVIEDRPEYIAHASPDETRARERVPVPFQVLINPCLEIIDGTPAEHFEGCLSVADFAMAVSRARAVKVQALDHHGAPVTLAYQGWPARILQHEVDHLRGVLCLDRMNSRTFATVRNQARFWAGRPVADVQAAVGQTDPVDASLAGAPDAVGVR